MFSFNDKAWWSSKTFWVSAITFAVGGAKAIGFEVPPYLLEMLVGFGLYSLRDAVGNNSKK